MSQCIRCCAVSFFAIARPRRSAGLTTEFSLDCLLEEQPRPGVLAKAWSALSETAKRCLAAGRRRPASQLPFRQRLARWRAAIAPRL
jgi:hypothetical protein